MSLKIWVVVALVLFGFGVVLGLAVPASGDILSGEIAGLQQFSETLLALPPGLMVLFIFLKNAFSLVFGFVLSPILCLMPIIALVVNGWLLGYVAAAAVQQSSVAVLLAGILPHGIIEIPAFVLGEAAAFSFGATSLIALFQSDSMRFASSLRVNLKYLGIAVVMLIPAVLIEAFITPLAIRLVQ